MSFSIAIDGPAGAGKSTIAKTLAKSLNYIYVDTGAMYRAITLYLLRNQIAADDIDAIKNVLDDIHITIEYTDGNQQVILNGENVNDYIRTEEVGKFTSTASKNQCIREKLVSLQRKLADTSDVIMDGRDIGTCVLPNANVKIFLTASAAKRAIRRYDELIAKGTVCNLDDIEKDIIARDHQDMTRDVSPLMQAEDAILVDTSDMTINEVVIAITNIIKTKN